MSGAEGAVATAAAKVMCSQSSFDFFSNWKLDGSLLAELETQLSSTKDLLNAAEIRLMEEGSFVELYRKARYAILDAEDLLALIITDINKEKYKLGDSPTTGDIIKEKLRYKGKDIVRTIHPSKSARGAEMRKAIQKLQSIAAQLTPRGTDTNAKLTEIRNTRISTSLGLDPSRFVGRSKNVEEIVRMLNSREGNDDALRIIPIIGMGGVGKTTLASVVYNAPETSQQLYKLKGWVCVSDKFDATHVVKSLVESLTGKPEVSVNPELLQKELKKLLKDQRYLLVLDDVWSDVESMWETLQTIFSVGAPGSRIIITTREERVVYIVNKSLRLSYEVNGLSDAEGWLLFRNHAFENGDSTAYPRLEKIGMDIVGKCKGLPLALKMIGSLLLSKGNDEMEWNFVFRSELWNSTSNILPSLWLSYHHLSRPLKQCFAYFSIFPKDYKFKMEDMVMFWVAEGLVEKPTQSRNSSYDYDDVARTYFKDLCSNFFIQQSHLDKSAFVMHDLLHDLAEYVSQGMLVDLNDINPESRRLSFIRGQNALLAKRAIRKLKRLRTFMSIEVSAIKGHSFTNKALLSNFKYLRVLSLENYSISVLPASIGDMKLLRYLNLAGTNIEYLPKWIGYLHNLQILQLSYCCRLKRLPSNLCDLVNLRHLIMKNPNFVEMPYGMGKLTNLRTLSYYVLGKDKSKQMREFKDLSNLQGKLRISGLNNVDDIEDVVIARFKNMEQLDKLVLEWEMIQERDMKLDERLLDAIKPHENLKGLSLHNYGGKRLSNWIAKVNSLTCLSITDCCSCEVLPPLGDLPFLKDLKIERLDSLRSLGIEFYGDGENPFSALQKLKISDVKILKIWYSPTGGRCGFSSLKELEIDTCDELAEIPSCFPSLTLLEINNCAKLGRVPSIGNSPFLKNVIINGLECLESLSEEFYGDVNNPFLVLENLRLMDMTILRKWCFPGGTRIGFSSLKELEIYNCNELTKIPYCFPSLVDLNIISCNQLVRLEMHDTEVKGSTSSLTTYGYSLRYLNISICANLEEIPKSFVNLLKFNIYRCESLISVPGLRHVQELELDKVALLRMEAETQDFSELKNELCIRGRSIEQFTSLKDQDLEIPNSTDIGSDDDDHHHVLRLPPNLSDLTVCGDIHTKVLTQICNLNYLKALRLSDCHTPKAFLDSVLPSTLKSLVFSCCPSLRTIPSQFFSGCSKHLEELEISGCPYLECLPDVFSDLESLQKLRLEKCPLIQHFPASNGLLLNSLFDLCISNCLNLKSLPEEFHNITTLRTLTIKACPNLVVPVDGFPGMITRLVIKNCGKMDPESNMKLSELTCLESLYLKGFSKTSTLDGFIPDSIEILRLRDFPRLESLPTLKRLAHSELDNCPLLNQNKKLKECLPLCW